MQPVNEGERIAVLDVNTLHCISPPPGLCPLPLRITKAAAQKPAADKTGDGLSVPVEAFESARRARDAGGILGPPLAGGGPAVPWHEAQLKEAAVQKPSQNYASDELFVPDPVKAFKNACLTWDSSSILFLPRTGGGYAAPWPKAQFETGVGEIVVDGPGDPTEAVGRWASLADCPLPAKVALAALSEEGEPPGMPSIGAIGHDLGLCRPCNFTTKADGCRQGEACRFCHACGPGMARKRKREKKKFRKGLLKCSDEPECTMV